MLRPSVHGVYDLAVLAVAAVVFAFIFLMLHVLERV
jgi:hypothetical protein